jgi:membrane fusion protein (multidrug efflux system)
VNVRNVRRIGWTGAVVIAGAVAACGGKGAAAGAAGQGGGPPPMPVEVVTARSDTVIDALPATGQIEAVQAIELRPEVDGRIVAILIREGQEVAAGTALFRVDEAELAAQVARAQADYDLARQALERTRQLVAENASSAADLERAEATARGTEAQLELLRIRLERTTIRAPFAGVVGQRFVSLGDYVTSNSRLVALQTVNPQRVAFGVPERNAAVVRPGQTVSFRVAAIPGATFTGTVDFVDPIVQLPARTILIKAVVPNPRRQLKAGMFVEARLATAVRPDAVVVPEDGILMLSGATLAWVVKDGKAERRQVVLGVRRPGWVEVRSGIAAGELVVVGGQERLGPGAPVMATEVRRSLGEDTAVAGETGR